MEKKLEDLQKSIQRDKQLGRWNNNASIGLNSTSKLVISYFLEYSRIVRSKKNIIIDERKGNKLNDLSQSTATSNKSKIDENYPRGRKLNQFNEEGMIIKNDSFLSNQKNEKKTHNIQLEELKAFLTKCGQNMYLDKFIDNGFDDMDVLLDIEPIHLNAMGMKPGHQIKLKKILSEYSKINKTSTSESFNNFETTSIKSNNSIRIRVSDTRLDSGNRKSQNSQINLNASTQSFDTNSVKINKIEMLESTKNFGTENKEKDEIINSLESPMTKSFQNVYIPQDDEFDYMSSSQVTQKSDTQCSKSSLNNKPNCNSKSEKNLQPYIEKKSNITERLSPNKKHNHIVKIDERDEIKQESKDCNMQTDFDNRAKFCFNCFQVIDNNAGDGPMTAPDFVDQVFCSKKCIKIQYLENSTFCKNEACEQGHFIKYKGVLAEGLWYCSSKCHMESSTYIQAINTMTNSNEFMDIDQETYNRMVKDHDSLEPTNYHLEEIEKDNNFQKDDVSIESEDVDYQDYNEIDLDLGEVKSFFSYKTEQSV